MNITDISIATMTWARDAAEERSLRKSLTALSRAGCPVFITDGGSNDSFLQFLHEFAQFTVVPASGKGVWPQVKSSLNAASTAGKPYVLYTEPDKHDFFAKGLLDFILGIETSDAFGIALAARSDDGFASYPAFQQMTETTINNCCAEIIGASLDYTYGPFVMNMKLITSLSSLESSIGWGWRPYAFVEAFRKGLTLDAYLGPYFCPPDQQEDSADERVYRMRQLEQNIRALVI